METDAYGSFVTVDVESISRLCSIGIIGGTQYADLADDVLSTPPRFFRHSLECTKRAVEYFRTQGVSVVAHLGDVLAAENADGGTQWAALQSFNDARAKLPGAACGSNGKSYYSFFPAARWRVLVLDANDSTGGFSAASASPGVPDGVLVGGSGSLGPVQLTWFGAQLSVASAEGERVLVMCSRGVRGGHPLGNADQVAERIAAYPGTVAAFLSLGDGHGHYEADAQGVHHISPLAAIGRDVSEDAFGCLEVFEDKLKIEMIGARPDVDKLPAGWPSELALPRGGALVRGGGVDGDFGFFLTFLFFVLRTVSLPLQSVAGLLMSNEMPEEAQADRDEGSPPDSGGGQAEGSDVASNGTPVKGVRQSSASTKVESGTPASGEPGMIV